MDNDVAGFGSEDFFKAQGEVTLIINGSAFAAADLCGSVLAKFCGSSRGFQEENNQTDDKAAYMEREQAPVF
jgi:hypothetical protein